VRARNPRRSLAAMSGDDARPETSLRRILQAVLSLRNAHFTRVSSF
jgi:hypothetical protein